jgi:uncharacterized protein (DUF885 family)
MLRDWPILYAEALGRAAAIDAATLAGVRRISRSKLDPDQQTLADLFEWELERRIEAFRLQIYLTPYWEDRRFGPSIEELLLKAPKAPKVASLDEYHIRIREMSAFRRFVKQWITLRSEAKRSGMMPPKERTQGLILMTTNLLRSPPESWPICAEASKFKLHAEVLSAIEHEILPGAKELREFLIHEWLPASSASPSLSQWTNGRDIYNELIRLSTGTRLTADDIYRIGTGEVSRLRNEMNAIVSRSGQQSLLQFRAAIIKDERFHFRTGAELLEGYRASVDRIEPLLTRLFRQVPVHSAAVEPTPNGGGVAAAYDPVEHVVYVDISRPDLHSKLEIIPLMLHENLPGHHLLSSIEPGNTFGAAKGAAIRRDCDAFTEGWALYAETLGEDLGLYTDPYSKFGQLSMELVRAVRLVIDSGIHSKGWSLEQAKEYFIAETGESELAAADEVMRSLFPGRSAGYKVGQLRFRAMREKVSSKLGPRFDLAKFHDTILHWGPLPLTVLEGKVDRCLMRPMDCPFAS